MIEDDGFVHGLGFMAKSRVQSRLFFTRANHSHDQDSVNGSFQLVTKDSGGQG